MTVQTSPMTVEQIEQAAQKLPVSELDGLVSRLSDLFHTRWEEQISEDAKAGRLDDLLNEAREEIRQGQTSPL